MKTIIPKALTGLAFAVAVAVDAADSTVPTTTASERYTETERRHLRSSADRLAAPSKASDLIGKSVTNNEGKTLGKVDDIAIDLESGRVSLVILSSGGFLGVGSKDIAVPPRAFSYDPASKTLRLDVDREKLKSAPAFEKSRWDDQIKPDRLTETYTYYGQEPYFANRADDTARDRDRDRDRNSASDSTRTDTTAPATRLDGTTINRADQRPASDVIQESRQFQNLQKNGTQLGWLNKASKVIGMPVINQEAKRYGQIDNLILDLETGRIVHVIVSSGGVLGIGDTLSVIPPNALRYNAARDAVQVNMTQEQLTAAPNFKSTEWPNFGDPAYSGKVYRAYGVDPYFTTDADNTSRNVRDRQPDRLSPLDQGNSQADLDLTRNIRQRLNEGDTLSVNAKNLKVITVNGRVTLRGPVDSDEERTRVLEIVKRQAPNSGVDDQIEVKRDTKNN